MSWARSAAIESFAVKRRVVELLKILQISSQPTGQLDCSKTSFLRRKLLMLPTGTVMHREAKSKTSELPEYYSGNCI